jgi:hypothetical protein
MDTWRVARDAQGSDDQSNAIPRPVCDSPGPIGDFEPRSSIRLRQFMLSLPLSHELPICLSQGFASPRFELVALTQAKYPNLTMIDVGANVGDFIAIVRWHVDAPILCVEGEDHFFSCSRSMRGSRPESSWSTRFLPVSPIK